MRGTNKLGQGVRSFGEIARGGLSGRAITRRAIMVAAVVTVGSSWAAAQQITDASLIGNKDWASGSNQGYVVTFDSLGNDRFNGQWKINARPGARGQPGIPNRIDTDWRPIVRGQWNYVVATFARNAGANGSTIVTAWGNGVNLSTREMGAANIDTYDSTRNGVPIYQDLNIGQDGTGNYTGGSGFIGFVDDVAIWRRALSASEIQSIYSAGVTGGSNLSSLLGTTPSIGDSLVGYYNFDGTANDTAPLSLTGSSATKNGAWKANDPASGPKYTAGLFGQAANLDGKNYVTIGDGKTGNGSFFPEDYKFATDTSFTLGLWVFEPVPALPAQAVFLPAGGVASNRSNWNVAPTDWTPDVVVNLSRSNTAANPVVFDGAFGSRTVKSFDFGAAGITTNVRFEAGASVTGVGAIDSNLGVDGSRVNLAFTGGTLLHTGPAEESKSLLVAGANSTVNINMTGGLLSSGHRIADAAYVTGWRRPALDGTELPRNGNDLRLGAGANSTVNMTVGGTAEVFAYDVLNVVDGNGSTVNVVQSDNSAIFANWDARFSDNGAANTTINWTLNGSSRFVSARDLSLGDSGDNGNHSITVNNSAQLVAGDRLWIGAGASASTNTTVTVNGGSVVIGRTTAGTPLLVDDTGRGPQQAVDYILMMGSGTNAKLVLNTGSVSIGRNAYVGFNGGSAVADINGGTFSILGIGPSGVARAGNEADSLPFPFLGAANFSEPWSDAGGDLLISIGGDPTRSAPVGAVNIRGNAVVNIARDTFVGGTYYAGSLSVPATGLSSAGLSVRGGAANVNINGNLIFGGVDFGGYIVGGNTVATLGAKLTGPTHSAVNVNGTAGGRNGDVLIFNSATEKVTSKIDAEIDVPYSTYRPATGSSVTLVQYAGVRTGEFSSVTNSSVDGIDWQVQYDDSGKKINLVAAKVYKDGNADRDAADTVTGADFDLLKAGFGQATSKKWSDGDFDNDNKVGLRDFTIQRASATPGVSNGLPVGSLVLTINTSSGAASLTGTSVSIAGFQITSAGGSLVGSNFPGAFSATGFFGDTAASVLASQSGDIAAASLNGIGSVVGSVALGSLYSVGSANDLVFSYTDLTSGVPVYVEGLVNYLTGPALVAGDFNFDGTGDFGDLDAALALLDEADPFAAFIAANGAAFQAFYGRPLVAADLVTMGDFNTDLSFDFGDLDGYLTFLDNGGSGISAGPASFGVIPEPAALGLLAPAALALGRRRR